MLVRQEGKGHWAALKRAFRLLVDDVDDHNPSDAAYVFSGHCPLTVSPKLPPPGQISCLPGPCVSLLLLYPASIRVPCTLSTQAYAIDMLSSLPCSQTQVAYLPVLLCWH